jgi:hypothetical protein
MLVDECGTDMKKWAAHGIKDAAHLKEVLAPLDYDIVGAAGVGKTFTVATMETEMGKISDAYGVGGPIKKMAPSNKAAFLIGGTSLHNKRGFNLPVTEKIEKWQEDLEGEAAIAHAKSWKGKSSAMIDESGMYADPIRAVAARCKKLAVSLSDGDCPIGEIGSGDGAQLPPVKATAGIMFPSTFRKLMAKVAPEKGQTEKSLLAEKKLSQEGAALIFPDQCIKLRVQKRQQNDKWYEGFSNRLRDAKHTSGNYEKVLEQTAYAIAAKVRKDHGMPDLTVHEALKIHRGDRQAVYLHTSNADVRRIYCKKLLLMHLLQCNSLAGFMIMSHLART